MAYLLTSGSIKCLEVEAEIVKIMDKQIFHSLLDRNIKFKDALSPLYLANIKRKYYMVIDKFLLTKGLISGQIDNSKIREIARDFTKTAELRILSINQKQNISNPLLINAVPNLLYILKIAN
jgi:Rps23 Pro-64 3,4-dihydroxylase Tpa1-like proline 4-hydroxylase